jgi:transposase-like protein
MVAAAVEYLDGKGLGRIRLEVVEDDSQASLFTFVRNNVVEGATVRTDGLIGYNEIPQGGYIHDRKVIGKDQKLASQLLPGVHRIFSLIKRWLLGTHQGAVSEKHLPAYLQEFTFRFNRRRSSHPIKLFYRLSQGVMNSAPISYKNLVSSANT